MQWGTLPVVSYSSDLLRTWLSHRLHSYINGQQLFVQEDTAQILTSSWRELRRPLPPSAGVWGQKGHNYWVWMHCTTTALHQVLWFQKSICSCSNNLERKVMSVVNCLRSMSRCWFSQLLMGSKELFFHSLSGRYLQKYPDSVENRVASTTGQTNGFSAICSHTVEGKYDSWNYKCGPLKLQMWCCQWRSKGMLNIAH